MSTNDKYIVTLFFANNSTEDKWTRIKFNEEELTNLTTFLESNTDRHWIKIYDIENESMYIDINKLEKVSVEPIKEDDD